MSSHEWEHDMLSDLSPDKTKTQGAPTVQPLKSVIIFHVSSQVVKLTYFDISLHEKYEHSYFIPYRIFADSRSLTYE